MKIVDRLIGSKKHMMSALLLLAGSLNAATITVPYPLPVGTTIQDYINLANSGDTIQFSAGTYTNVTEFYVVSSPTHPMTTLNIVGAGNGPDGTIIQAPSSSTLLASTQMFAYPASAPTPIPQYWSVINVDNQHGSANPLTVNISNLVVDASNQQDNTFYGNGNIAGDKNFGTIGYHNASGTIENVHAKNARQSAAIATPSDGTGIGIFNGLDNGGTAVLNVTDSFVDFYQRYGIKCSGSNLTANITGCTVNRGYVLPPAPHGDTTAPNGIEFASGATGTIDCNVVSNNISADATGGGSGIIIFQADAVITGNTVNSNDNGIVSYYADCSIQDNTVTYTAAPSQITSIEGILVYEATATNVVDSNVVNYSNITNLVSPYLTYFMDLESSTNQTIALSHNQFLGSTAGNQVGLYIVGSGTSTTSPVVTMNGDTFTSFTASGALYVDEVTAPNNVWPSSDMVSYDGLVPGFMTEAQFNYLVANKIVDHNTNSALGLVLSYVTPILAPPSEFVGQVTTVRFGNKVKYELTTSWTASPTANVSYYAIYNNGELVAEVSADAPLVYNTYVNSLYEAQGFEVSTVNVYDQESTAVAIVIN